MDFEQAADVAERAAREAGAVLEDWAKRFTATEKSRANLVTEADFASQETIHQILSSEFPGHGFLGEEDLHEAGTGSEFRWVIDPLDGTGNYVHRFPYYAVSIALQQGPDLVAGVIFDPNRDELFRAVAGQGATLNGAPLGVSHTEALSEAMAVASLPPAAGSDHPAVTRFLRVIPHAQSLQRTGSAALNLSYVAAGRIDAYWSTSLKPWDMAAGVLIVREAGGNVTQLGGTTFDLEVPDLLASNGSPLHAELQELLG